MASEINILISYLQKYEWLKINILILVKHLIDNLQLRLNFHNIKTKMLIIEFLLIDKIPF